MAKKTFNLADHMSLADVSNSDTAPVLTSIDIDRIDSNEANFYDLSNLKPLADSIALDGLQQPLVVMPGENGHYTLLSGHRRRAAILSLVNDETEPRPELRAVPCMVKTYSSPEMAELQLILANSTARVLTPAEVSKQAERVTELLYKLKESGVEFPGRMRDHVAEACNVSASKLARLKVIREKLVPEALQSFDSGSIAESAAYALAQLPADNQTDVFSSFGKEPPVEWLVTERAKQLARIESITCNGTPCTNKKQMFAETCKGKNRYCSLNCSTNGKCCKSCSRLYECQSACPSLEQQIKKHKADLKDERLAQKNKEETERLNLIAYLSKYWLREGMARERAGVSSESVDELLKSMYCYAWPCPENLKHYEMGDCDDGYYCKNYVHHLPAKVFSALADLYGCSVDYLLCRTDDPVPWVSAWRSVEDGQLPSKGDYVFVLIGMHGVPTPSVYWNHSFMDCTEKSVANMEIRGVTQWMPMPVAPAGRQYNGAETLKMLMEEGDWFCKDGERKEQADESIT